MELNNSRLPDFLFAAAARPFQWGQFDCAIWLADWYVEATRQPDPVAEWRGTYRDEASCAAKFGHAAAARMLREVARRTGLVRTTDPFFGDIGVVEIPLPKQQICGAIRARNSWVLLKPNGLVRIPDDQCRTVMAFRIKETECHR
jgi:hypothetical protein